MTRSERIKAVYEYLRYKQAIRTQKEFAQMIDMNATNLSSAMNGKEDYLTDKLFQKVHAATDGIFRLEWLLSGEGEMLSTIDNSRTIVNNTGIANNGDNAIVNPPAPSKELDTMLEMLKMKDAQIGELISQNGKLMTIIETLTSK